MIEETRVTKEFDRLGVKYRFMWDTTTGLVSGLEIANGLNADPSRVFKTLIMRGKSGSFYVFMIPVNKKMDLHKAKEIAGERLSMADAEQLEEHAGYVQGGCSPVALKEKMRIYFDETAEKYDTIIFGAGVNSYHVEVSLSELEKAVEFSLVRLCVGE